jgi:hypothetical protein
LTVTYFLFGSFEGLNPGTVRDSACRGIYFEAEEAGSNFFSNWLQDCPIGIFGAGVVVGDNQLIEVRNPWPVAHPFGIQIQNEQAVIRNNRFRFGRRLLRRSLMLRSLPEFSKRFLRVLPPL